MCVCVGGACIEQKRQIPEKLRYDFRVPRSSQVPERHRQSWGHLSRGVACTACTLTGLQGQPRAVRHCPPPQTSAPCACRQGTPAFCERCHRLEDDRGRRQGCVCHCGRSGSLSREGGASPDDIGSPGRPEYHSDDTQLPRVSTSPPPNRCCLPRTSPYLSRLTAASCEDDRRIAHHVRSKLQFC